MMNPVPWLQMTNMISYQGLVRTFPKSSGGTNEYLNLKPSCEGCNRTKRTWSIEEFRIRLAIKQSANGVSFNAAQIELLKATGCLDLLGVNQNLRFYFETMKNDAGQE